MRNEGYGLQRHASDENAARTIAIHEKSHRRLYKSRGQAECRERKTELGEAYTIDFPQHRKQRRQQQQVEVAEKVPGADESDDFCIARQWRDIRIYRHGVTEAEGRRRRAAGPWRIANAPKVPTR